LEKGNIFYMPDCLHGWRLGSNDGNPTKSVEVNDFIKREKVGGKETGGRLPKNLTTDARNRVSTPTQDFQVVVAACRGL
jgi:hypothetical protein